jgi:hypothetical protein
MSNILFDTMYRDGANYKSYDYIVFSNRNELSAEQVKEALCDACFPFEEYVPSFYELPSLAPIDNPYMDSGNDYDHCYMELCNIEETNEEPDIDLPDISDFIEKVKKGTKEAERKALDDARQHYLEKIESLTRFY